LWGLGFRVCSVKLNLNFVFVLHSTKKGDGGLTWQRL
jgi:hypothetical protein